MVLNVVLHRLNIDHVGEILEMAEAMGAQYVELANTQYYGWHGSTASTSCQPCTARARGSDHAALSRARGGEDADLFRGAGLLRDPAQGLHERPGVGISRDRADGTALPCHAARMLPGLQLPNVRDSDIRTIWYDSPASTASRRGVDEEPCRSCPERTKDFGGCRCQAYLLTGDADNADRCAICPRTIIG